MRRLAFGVILLCGLAGAEPSSGPLCFEANRGQFEAGSTAAADQHRWQALFQSGAVELRMKYLVGDPGPSKITAELARRRAVERSKDPRPRSFRVRFGAVAPRLEDQRAGRTNYFHGPDAPAWLEASHYGRVRYRDVWPGVDLIFHGSEGVIECDVEVAAGADPSQVALAFDGVSRFGRDSGGGMRVDAAWGVFRQKAPRSGGRTIPGSYRQAGDGRVVFVAD